MTKHPDAVLSRRTLLATGTLAFTSSVAGCLGYTESDDDADIPDIDTAALRELETADVPAIPSPLPIEVTDEHFEAQRERTQELLEPITDDDISAVPNELIREDLADLVERAEDRFSSFEETPTDEREFSDIRSARQAAGEARGGYDAAIAGRTYDDAMADAETLETEMTTVQESLERTGDDGAEALIVYNEIEDHLVSGMKETERLKILSPEASAFEAVSEIDRHVETATSHLGVATHLDEQYDGAETYSDQFETAANVLAERLDDRLDDLPAGEFEDVSEALFDEIVDETPRERVVHLAMNTKRGEETLQELLADGFVARATVRAFTLLRDSDAIEPLRDRVGDGDLDRPESVEDISALRDDALNAIENQRGEAGPEPLVETGLIDAIEGIYLADNDREQIASPRHDSHEISRVTGRYAVAAERARAVPEAVSELQDALEA